LSASNSADKRAWLVPSSANCWCQGSLLWKIFNQPKSKSILLHRQYWWFFGQPEDDPPAATAKRSPAAIDRLPELSNGKHWILYAEEGLALQRIADAMDTHHRNR